MVIVAARNAGLWLTDCVRAILVQELPPGWSLGVAVGIDSCPATLASATQLHGHRNLAIRYFPDHVGPYVVYNSLAWSTRSDVLVRFDADDLMLPGYLARQLAKLDARLSPTVVRTWSRYVDSALRPIAAPLAGGVRTPRDGRRARPSDGQFMMTRNVFDRLGGFQAWRCHADTEFLQRARFAGVPFTVVEDFLYLRRVHPASLTSSGQTGYVSLYRGHRARQLEAARLHYASGGIPERIQPALARYLPCGGCA